ncbi:short chain dehydrogenase [Frankia sp. EI5c]|uniref:SDR family NAD(P)-dependent oxidoreductase n=1 Tax=Frankia sp. EI5c TaxID=683316 RepID=UPI0007C29921|nr:SDR family NAD(P)-dependent oxidoreductase [Frankia sp. EI5c]OAA28581.1 short chain dehydrogenase [Frankia sp. EI5c]
MLVSSQAGVRGMATAGAYGASKAAAERWAEALAHEIAPFGLGVTVVVTGTFDTDILVRTVFHERPDSAYRPFQIAVGSMAANVHRLALPPERFARGLARALGDTAPYSRRAIGRDARLLLLTRRLLPDRTLHRLGRVVTRIPGPGELRGTAYPGGT